ncbi:hypothetical protein [Thalassotalea sp. LPB0316]|uniref:hypothetical protein n=1 Tax=Thalassotalea sp. LPB0316 TaxID=2769490 RepID=UPI001D037E59|nr:hypothetical protein [Thalassotalea sp. LPB0316]
MPTCGECHRFASKAQVNDIFAVRSEVKKMLIHHYRKDLAIGLNWTKQALEESEFDGGNFEGFKRSAWFMYEVAKGRVNFRAWPIEVNGIALENLLIEQEFSFDGMVFPHIDAAIAHYAKAFRLDRYFLKRLVYQLTSDKFSRAVSLARIHIDATEQEKQAILRALS